MNEHNHHEIIGKFAKGKSGVDIQTLEEASDFTDDFRGILKMEIADNPIGVAKDTINEITAKTFNSAVSSAITSSVNRLGNPIAIATDTIIGASRSMIDSINSNEVIVEVTDETQFFYYHFFYEICVEKGAVGEGKIRLKRNNQDSDTKPESFLLTNDLGKNGNKYLGNPKLFFTAVNDREDYYIEEFGEGSNQSNCVAFLHAMGAETKHKGFYELDSLYTFKEHLKKCFAEYLFVKNDKDALFMLGIALHGIMDSFTPSHAGFQVYRMQDMGLHAQGDVLPIRNGKKIETMKFVPGQYSNETKAIMKYLAKYKKGYDDDDELNTREYEMLRCFLIISRVAYKRNRIELGLDEINNLCSFFKRNHITLTKINKVLSKGFTYGKSAYDYSNKAIGALNSVYEILFDARTKITNYNDYKTAKENNCKTAVDAWLNIFKTIDTHLIFKKEYLNRFRPSFLTTKYGIVDNFVEKKVNFIGQVATTAINSASLTYQISKDTILGTGKEVGDMVSDTGIKAVEIAKSVLTQ